jgi:hypothetical protein
MGTVARVHDFLGLDLDAETERVIDEWQRANRTGARGSHRYTPEQFGLSAAEIRDEYDFYIRRFDVHVDG